MRELHVFLAIAAAATVVVLGLVSSTAEGPTTANSDAALAQTR